MQGSDVSARFPESLGTCYDGSYVFFLNSHYTEDNASRSILEFLDMIRTNDLEKVYETPLGQKAKERVQEVRSDRTLEVAYMTYAQKMLDERKLAFHEGLIEGEAREEARGHAEGVNESIAALKKDFLNLPSLPRSLRSPWNGF